MVQTSYDTTVITEQFVAALIREQFPAWIGLLVKSVDIQGHDNRTFRLGTELLVRLPIAQAYALKVKKEQQWLPIIASKLSLQIPTPVALGKPSKKYPWHWSIYRWIEGKSLNLVGKSEVHLPTLAVGIVQFLTELHRIDIFDHELAPGLHNWWRGGALAVYDAQTKFALEKLQNRIDTVAALAVWQKALSSSWHKRPVWVHGDLAVGNMVIDNNQNLCGIIDFGCMGIGDPACDLVLAWTLFTGQSRALFKESVGLDLHTWQRARGWALWKALITVLELEKKNLPELAEPLHCIEELIEEHRRDIS